MVSHWHCKETFSLIYWLTNFGPCLQWSYSQSQVGVPSAIPHYYEWPLGRHNPRGLSKLCCLISCEMLSRPNVVWSTDMSGVSPGERSWSVWPPHNQSVMLVEFKTSTKVLITRKKSELGISFFFKTHTSLALINVIINTNVAVVMCQNLSAEQSSVTSYAVGLCNLASMSEQPCTVSIMGFGEHYWNNLAFIVQQFYQKVWPSWLSKWSELTNHMVSYLSVTTQYVHFLK